MEILFSFPLSSVGNGIAGWYSRYIFVFLRKLHTVCHSGWTNLHSHQRCTCIPFPPHPCQPPVVSCLLDNGHPDRCEADDTEHLVSCLLAIFMCSSVLFFCTKADPALTFFTLPVNEIIQMLTHTLCVCRVGFFMVS